MLECIQRKEASGRNTYLYSKYKRNLCASKFMTDPNSDKEIKI